MTTRRARPSLTLTSIATLLLIVVLARDLVAQTAPSAAVATRQRRIDQELAALLAPIPIYISPDEIFSMQGLRVRGTANLKQVPLNDAVDRLSHQFNVTMLIDTRALEEASITPDEPITIQQTDVPLRSLLDQMLHPLELTWILSEGVILVTTMEKSKTQLVTELYPVQDLIGAAPQNLRFSSLIHGIERKVDADSWVEAGGPGRIMAIPSFGVLVISQTEQAHEHILSYLAALRQRNPHRGDATIDWEAARFAALESIAGETAQGARPELSIEMTAAEPRLLAQLEQVIPIEARETPFDQWARTLRQRHKISIGLDRRALEEASVPFDFPISCSLRNRPLRIALHFALEPLDLTYHLRDEQIVITTVERAKTEIEARFYPIADLTAHHANAGHLKADTLLKLVQECISPDSWEEAGGPGRIFFHPLSRSLAVNSTMEVHSQVNDFLTTIRVAKNRLQNLRQRLESRQPPPNHVFEAPVFEETPPSLRSIRRTAPVSVEAPRESGSVQARLKTRMSAELPSIPLGELIDRLKKQYGLNFIVDPSVKSQGFNLKSDVSLEVRDVSLDCVLRVVLSQLHLMHRVVGDDVVIATPDAMNSTLTTVVHPVHDLATSRWGSDCDSLAQFVTEMVAADSWEDAGGPAQISVNPDSKSLIISQIPETHAQVQQVLIALRRAKAVARAQMQPAAGASKATSIASERSAPLEPLIELWGVPNR